jgi:hypothetical protein
MLSRRQGERDCALASFLLCGGLLNRSLAQLITLWSSPLRFLRSADNLYGDIARTFAIIFFAFVQIHSGTA